MNRHGARRRRRAQRVYRLLVRLYPAAHRRAFGDDMVLAFGDHYRDAVQDQGGSRLRFWLAVLADTGSSLSTEYAASLKARKLRPRRRRRLRLRTRRRIAVVAVLVALVGVAFGTGTATGHAVLSMSILGTALLVAAGLGVAMRRSRRRVPAGPHGNGPAPPGGAGVREPRRPLPISSAGSAARPLPDQDFPGQTAAVI